MLTESEIIAALDKKLNSNRGESMFVEVKFAVDFEAGTILSFDVDGNEWLVNYFFVRSADDTVVIEPNPIMTFPAGSL